MVTSPRRPALPVPERPVLAGFYRVVPMGPDLLQVRSAGRVLRVEGPGVGDFGPRLLALLDGTETVAGAAERLAIAVAPAADLVGHLHAQGMVSDAAGGPPPAAGATVQEAYGENGAAAARVQASIDAARVAFVGLGPVAELAARHLEAAGVRQLTSTTTLPCEGRADLVVVEVDETGERASAANQRAVEVGAPTLFHTATALEGRVGPFVNGPGHGCHRCLVERVHSHLRHYDEQVAFERWLVATGASREPALLGGFVGLLAGLVSLEALRVIGGWRQPVTRGGVLVADLHRSTVCREVLLPVPACPACGGRSGHP